MGQTRKAERDQPRLTAVGVEAPAQQAMSGSPGADLLARLTELVASSTLTPREWLEAAVAARAMVSFCQALQLVCVRELDQALDGAALAGSPAGRPVLPAGRRAADELAPALGIAPRTATDLVALARRADEDLPAAADALADGRMSLAQLRVLDQVTRGLPAPATRAVEAAAMREAPRRTTAQLRVALTSEAARLDPAHHAGAVERGVADRDVRLTPSPLPGCRRLLLALHAVAAWHAVNGAAVAAKRQAVPEAAGQERSLPQLRADLATAVLTGGLGGEAPHDPPTGPVPSGAQLTRYAEVHVVVAHDTLTGTSDLPAHLAGIGPLDADTAREVARTAPLRRLVADAAGGVLLHRGERARAAHPGARAAHDPRLSELLGDPVTDPGALTTPTYRPGARLGAHVHTRDQTCIGPACEHSTRGTDLDHTVDYGRPGPAGAPGVTAAANLGSPCRRAHDSKTHGGWSLAQPTPGTFVWTSPTGRTYRVDARPLVPGWRQRSRSPDGEPP